MSFVLMCCAGGTILGALAGDPDPVRTGTAADEQPAPAIAATAQPAPGESTADSVGGEPAPAESTGPSDTTLSPTSAPSPVVQKRTVVEKKPVRHGSRTVKDSSMAEGKRVVRTRGVDGVRTLTYQVTVIDGVQTEKELLDSAVTRKPVTEVVAEGTKPASRCDPNYTPCVPIASDVDCAGGSGDGPAYVTGPVKVIGADIYDLDRDNDGYGCD
ncbi:G5 domain-containing protein [Micromonospora sp. LOL_024]|uniref:G5 domain-containing protein n=1 Tax=Micromonospora sp. LOL_024 TaxID=3345412 RepID=UPI003A893231